MDSANPQSRLMVLLFSDIVGSTALKSRLGTAAYADLLTRHDHIFKKLIADTPGATILKDMGDGYFASLATASDAVRVALLFQYAMAHEPWGEVPLTTRVGIHIGEVVELDLESTGIPKVIGLAADLTARVMSLGQGGQILLTRLAFNEARQFVARHPGIPPGPAGVPVAAPELRWVAHGPYLFKGSDERTEVFEVGGLGIAPLAAPPDADKARRVVAADEEQLLGWRPAAGLDVPGRGNWVLERKLGEGGFGEVWLGRHRKLSQRRVFKFCYEVERLRSFKREMTLFRLIREALGERKDIARLHEVRLDEPPFYLESEYTEGGNLADWARERGGIARVPLAIRLELVAGTAVAAAAAHSVGIVHKDIKPSNILVYEEEGRPHPRLADFGIGILKDTTALQQRDITITGFTQITENDSSRTGTRLYAPPELLAGKPFSIQGDVYSLGVLLYQMIVGDLERPLGIGWERDIPDELLCQDVAACVDGDSAKRLAAAGELAHRLRSLDARRAERLRLAQQQRAALRRRRATRLAASAVVVLIALLAVVAVSLFRERRLKLAAMNEADRANREATKAKAVIRALREMVSAANPEKAGRPDMTVREALAAFAGGVDNGGLAAQPDVRASVHSALGDTYWALGDFDAAQRQLREALLLKDELTHGAGDLETADILELLSEIVASRGDVRERIMAQGELPRAEAKSREDAYGLMSRALVIRRATLRPGDPLIHQTEVNLANYTAFGVDRDEGEDMLLEMIRPFIGKKDTVETRATVVAAVAQSKFAWREGRKDASYAAIRRELDAPLKDPKLHKDAVEVLAMIAQRQLARDDYEGAVPMFEAALRLGRELFHGENPIVVRVMAEYGWAQCAAKHPEEGEPRLREAVEIARRTLPTADRTSLYRAMWAGALLRQGRRGEADAVRDELLKAVEGQKPRSAAGACAALGEYAAEYDPRWALPALREAVERGRTACGPADPFTLQCAARLEQALRATEDLDGAERLCQACLADMDRAGSGDDVWRGTFYCRRGLIREARHDAAGAEEWYRRAVEALGTNAGPSEALFASTWNLGLLVRARGGGTPAAPWGTNDGDAGSYFARALEAARVLHGTDSPRYEAYLKQAIELVRPTAGGAEWVFQFSGLRARSLRLRGGAGDLDEAEQLLRGMLLARDAAPAAPAPAAPAAADMADSPCGLDLAELLLARRQAAEAQAVARAELKRWAELRPNPANQARARDLLARVARLPAAPISTAATTVPGAAANGPAATHPADPHSGRRTEWGAAAP